MKNTAKFSTIEEGLSLVKKLPKATMIPLYGTYEDQKKGTKDKIKLLKNRGVLNLRTMQVAYISSRHYKIIQHRGFFEACLDAIAEFDGGSFKGAFKVDGAGNEVMLDIYYNSKLIKDDSEKGIRLGFRMTNSYKGSKAASVLFYGYRAVCDNGMILGFHNKDRFYQKHIGNFDQIEKNLPGFFARVMENKERVQSTIQRMISTSINMDEYLEKYFRREERLEGFWDSIIALVNIEKDKAGLKAPNAYNFYNATTHIATHRSRSLGKEAYLQNKAIRILADHARKIEK